MKTGDHGTTSLRTGEKMLDIERIKALGWIYKEQIRKAFEADNISEAFIEIEQGAIDSFIEYLERMNGEITAKQSSPLSKRSRWAQSTAGTCLKKSQSRQGSRTQKSAKRTSRTAIPPTLSLTSRSTTIRWVGGSTRVPKTKEER